MKKLLLFALLVLVTSTSARSAAGDATTLPGFVDGSAIKDFASEDGTLVEVNLSGAMLKAMGNMFGEGDADVKQTIGGLHSITALIVGVPPDRSDAAHAFVRKQAESLLKRGWEAIARVRDQGESVNVLAKTDTDGSHFQGLVILIAGKEDYADGEDAVDDPDDESGARPKPTVKTRKIPEGQVVFVNIVGRFTYDQIKRLSEKQGLDVPGLKEIGEAEALPGPKNSKAPAATTTPTPRKPDMEM